MLDWLWLAWVAAFFALEIPAVLNARKGDTLSEQFRLWFHTGTTTGRIVWLVTFAAFALWFGPHIAF